MLEDLIQRQRDHSSWQKIPWNDPEFSRRMLREHLTQEHDAASRRTPLIDNGVDWIHSAVLDGEPSSILDLGCGPGFYTHRFVNLGHSCIGIDFGPASVEYAREHHAGEFVLDDVVTAEYGGGYDLVCMIYGELNAFAPQDARQIVEKAHRALKPGGALLLEVMDTGTISRMGHEPPTWYTAEEGLWSDDAHLVLQESTFDDNCSCSWHYVIDAETGSMDQYVAMHQAYTDDEYRNLMREFSAIELFPSLTGESEGDGFFSVILAKK